MHASAPPVLDPRYQDILKDNGSGFFVGDSVTIADCAMLPQLRQLKSGRYAFSPADLSCDWVKPGWPESR